VAGDGRAILPHDRRETLDYVVREMTSREGGFYSTQDADSEGEEGKFFKEIAIVGEPDADDMRSLLAVARDGYRPFQVVALGSPASGGLLSHFCRTAAWSMETLRPMCVSASLARRGNGARGAAGAAGAPMILFCVGRR